MASRIGFPDTRWSLIGRLSLQPDEAAVVLELYAGSITRYLHAKLPNESELDDIIQEVLLHLFAHPDLMAAAQPGTGSRFRYLLMTLAWNEARNRLRERWRRQHHERGGFGSLAQLPEAGTSDTTSMDRAWAESLLEQAWADVRGWASDGTLESEIPNILHEYLVVGGNLRDLASRLGMPLATCHRRLARGRTYLQKAIIDRLRQSGELAANDDAAEACAVLLDILKP